MFELILLTLLGNHSGKDRGPSKREFQEYESDLKELIKQMRREGSE